MDKQQQYLNLLQRLNSEQFVSGNDLAVQLGHTRTVVHRRLQELQAMGVPIHAIPGRGYRLVHGDILLSDYQDLIAEDIHHSHHLITASTNAGWR